jgi:hypothetical protein
MSIKKKFVTAVATAGLLAGLFGSALVPSALARGAASAVPVAAHSDVYSDSEFDDKPSWTAMNGGTADYSTSKKNQFTIVARNTDQDNANNDHSVGFYLGDKDSADITQADLSATSTGIVKVAFAYKKDGAGKNAACSNHNLTNAFALTDSVKGIKSNGAHYNQAGEYSLCLKPNYTTPGVSTITITANGAKIFTLTVKVLGDLKSLTVSTTYGTNAIAESNDNMHNFFKVVGKDAAGQVINGAGRGTGGDADFNLYWYTDDNGLDLLGANDEDGSTAVKHKNGSVIDFSGAGWYRERSADGYSFQPYYAATGSQAWTLVDLASDTCAAESYKGAGDADAGSSFAAGFEMRDYDDVNVIKSNTVTLSCTGPSSGAVASAITAESVLGEADWAASTAGKADADGTIGVYATVKDAAGRAMGLDSTIGFNVAYSADFSSDLNIGEWQGPSIGGKVMIGYITPDMGALAKYSYKFTIDDPDQANTDGNDQADLKATLYYTAASGITLDFSISRTRNAARTQATFKADYGVACSNARIGFDWENNDGSKYGSVTRKANIDGVATFVMNRRNTKIWVTATGCDNLNADTDPIGARFK